MKTEPTAAQTIEAVQATLRLHPDSTLEQLLAIDLNALPQFPCNVRCSDNDEGVWAYNRAEIAQIWLNYDGDRAECLSPAEVDALPKRDGYDCDDTPESFYCIAHMSGVTARSRNHFRRSDLVPGAYGSTPEEAWERVNLGGNNPSWDSMSDYIEAAIERFEEGNEDDIDAAVGLAKRWLSINHDF